LNENDVTAVFYVCVALVLIVRSVVGFLERRG
jgi:hypothetical protein